MADRNLELALMIKTDVDKAIRDFQRTEKEILDQGKAADKSKRKLSGMAGSYKALVGAVGAYLSLQAAKNVLLEADAYQVLQQRIRTATRETGDYVEVSRRLYEITQRNGVALRDTVSTFQSLARSREALGATNAEMLVRTDTVQKLGVIGGSTNQQLAAGLLQFSQALTAGTVRAEEVNSILENIPEVARRIEKGLKLMPGTLKNAVNEGRVLSRDVFRTLVDQADGIRREFDEMEASLGRAATRFGNAVDRALGKLLGGQKGLTGILSQSLDGWTALIDRMADGRDISEEITELTQKRLELLERIKNVPEPGKEGLRRYLKHLEERLRALNEQALALSKPPGGDGKGEGPPPSPDPEAERQRKEREALVKRIDRTVQALEIEAATYGETAREAALYELRLRGATEAQLKRAQAALESVAADEAFEEAVRQSEEAVKAQNAAYQDWVEGQREYLETVIASVDPTHELTGELERLEVLMRQFPEHAGLIQEAMLNVHERMDALGEKTAENAGQMNEFAIQAARNMQTAFADFLFDPFDEGMQGMLRGFIDTIRRMVAELLAQQAVTFLLGDFAKTGIVGGLIGGFVNHQGGIVGAGGPTRPINPFAFINAPRYHNGGVLGLKPDEVPIIGQIGEEMLSRTDPRNSANGGGQVAIRNILVHDRANLGDYLRSADGERVQVEFITRNASTIKRLLS